jgi:hypothetical protein
MAKAGYTVTTNGAVALTGGAAKTVLAVLAPAQFGVDGVTASAVPALVELCSLTAATNSTPGTNNTNQTSAIQQAYGRSITTGFSAFSASTTEPTVLAAIDSWLLSPTGGLVLYDFPLGDTPDSAVSQGFAIRVNAPAAVNVRAAMWFERC